MLYVVIVYTMICLHFFTIAENRGNRNAYSNFVKFIIHSNYAIFRYVRFIYPRSLKKLFLIWENVYRNSLIWYEKIFSWSVKNKKLA